MFKLSTSTGKLTFEILQRLEMWIQMKGGIALKKNRTKSVGYVCELGGDLI